MAGFAISSRARVHPIDQALQTLQCYSLEHRGFSTIMEILHEMAHDDCRLNRALYEHRGTSLPPPSPCRHGRIDFRDLRRISKSAKAGSNERVSRIEAFFPKHGSTE